MSTGSEYLGNNCMILNERMLCGGSAMVQPRYMDYYGYARQEHTVKHTLASIYMIGGVQLNPSS